jgi:delta14-sterol reductase
VIAGFLAPWIACAVILALHVALPGRWVGGYVRDAAGRPLRYRLNGLLVLAVSVGLAAALVALGAVEADWLWEQRWAALAGAVALGLAFTAWIVLPAPPVGSLGTDLYLGRLENPRWGGGRVDAKMFLYLYGAVVLELVVLSFAAHADPLRAEVVVYAALFTWFVVDYLTFERVHLYTYDLFAERVGFKLGWGCLAFYPWFYPVGLWSQAGEGDPGAPWWLLALAVAVFLTGWTLARGANMQKFRFKRDPSRGEAIGGVLLCSGFWGVSRHVNYLGEILMATGLTLALGDPADPIPWLYPLYYLVLLLPRERDDDRRCAAKYGELWDEYRARVPWRIIPGVY